VTDPAGGGGETPPGVLQSLRDLVGGAVAALQTRLQLLSVDAQEAGWRLAAIVLYGIVALFCLFVGTVLLALLIIVVFWDRSPALAVGLLSLFFLLAGAGCALLARRHARVAPGLFAATLDALARDREALSASPPAAGRGGAATPR
jgi:uncharacterized membrane protein YqjE